jgi:hypothetical protein
MATATAAQRRDVKEYVFVWEGFDRNNRQVRGEIRAASETVVTTNLRRQGIRVTRVKKQSFRGGRRVGDKDVTFFTRQLATMLRAGVPLLQAFDIVARGHSNARFSRLMLDIKGRIEAGSSLSQAFREHPAQFDNLYCNLVSAGETSGMLDAILERLATYKEKILAIKSKIKAALFYPISVVVVAIVVVWVIMIWVIPAFKQVFTSFGAGPAGAHADGDGDVGLLRHLLVADGDHRRRRAAGSSCCCDDRRRSAMASTASRSRFRSSATFSKRRRSRAGRARSRRCSRRAFRWSSRSTRWPAPRAIPSTRRHQAHPDRGQHRREPHQLDVEHASSSVDGAADDAVALTLLSVTPLITPHNR